MVAGLAPYTALEGSWGRAFLHGGGQSTGMQVPLPWASFVSFAPLLMRFSECGVFF